ncbi:MAG: hypothetical protein EBZ47_02985 [Chlamydiae bacterium]|nr:hypothetical protein [Chlamydiota bacterium]
MFSDFMNLSKSGPYQSPSSQRLLGDYTYRLNTFEDLTDLIAKFSTENFRSKGEKIKSELINQTLCDLIQNEQEPCFLLGAAIDFIDRIKKSNILLSYSLNHFELWLNQFSGLSFEENYRIRGKIVGKYVPRDAYQGIFPIGMGKMYPGSHYVTAHGSPDLDTTVASFWGWVDAFGARVSHGLHVWNIPGGPPSSQVEIGFLFDSFFGQSIFNHASKSRTSLALSSLDLMSQKGLLKKRLEESTSSIDHERNTNAVVVIDREGHFIGDWRSVDVEGVKQVVLQLNSCLRWLESYLHSEIVSLFAKEHLTRSDFLSFAHNLFGKSLSECEVLKELSKKQITHLNDFLIKVLKVSGGLACSYCEFAEAMAKLGLEALGQFIQLFDGLAESSLFDIHDRVVEVRPEIFNALEKVILGLEKAIQQIKDYTDTLSIALDIKKDVLGHTPQIISYRADVDEIKNKMSNYSYLTVTSSDEEGRLQPLGIIHSVDVQKVVLGTVTLRDFCNREETKIPAYFEVISVIDHHKTALSTSSTPMAFISDQQSSNALVAEKAFEINNAFSLEGLSLDQMQTQVKSLMEDMTSSENKRVLQKLLQKQIIASCQGDFFVHPHREFLEYLHCFYAILDDTDLLSKISYRDLDCLASLINRMKTIAEGVQTEVILFDDLPRDSQFVARAAKRILQNRDVYSLYRKIYHLKEQNNGCCRVGQTKLFAKNYPTYCASAPEIRALWYADARKFHQERSEFDLHIHMVSTIPGAEDVFAGTEGSYDHKDELWLWIPTSEQAVEHLKSFLNAFKQISFLANNDLEIEFLGNNAKELELVFKESFFSVPKKTYESDKKISIPLAVLRYKAGTLNSRKAMISPYLPKLG